MLYDLSMIIAYGINAKHKQLLGESDENHTASLPSSKNKKLKKKLLKSTLNLNPQ